ncbi:cupin domain-containing protein [Jannaschia donghaensis]|uniref:Cupin domain protein n=1 Tax=Jannaschia donghaensis TaxID=420998 RepID=A0A0M6YFV0_9RHOB|nr:cupin domain-containing protein [Jannaschia donghaensis]CTQ49242.1 Cupin domain protein [Jannaschia donghaensis]
MTEFPVVPSGENVTRQVLADHADLMVVAFRFGAVGAEGALHDHPHVQSTYVESGRFRFTLGDETREVGPGDSFVIPSGLTHGCVCLEPGTLVDGFTPRRDDFL